MEKLQSLIINHLTNGNGFYMESYRSEFRNSYNYIGIKSLQEGNYVVIITDDIYERTDTEEAIRYLQNKGITRYSLNKIILTNGDYVNRAEIYSKVVVDYTKNSILHCDESCRPLANIIGNILNSTAKRERSTMNKKYMYTTLGIIAINIIIFLIAVIKSGYSTNINIEVLVQMGGKVGVLIDLSHEYWRLFTCMFLHSDIMHIVFNMYALFILGPQIELAFGRAKFLIIYFASGLSSSLLSYWLGDDMIVSVGASGAIFGLLGGLLVFIIRHRSKVSNSSIYNILFIIALNLMIGFSSENIDNLGHIGGLILGIVLSALFVLLNTKGRFKQS